MRSGAAAGESRGGRRRRTSKPGALEAPGALDRGERFGEADQHAGTARRRACEGGGDLQRLLHLGRFLDTPLDRGSHPCQRPSSTSPSTASASHPRRWSDAERDVWLSEADFTASLEAIRTLPRATVSFDDGNASDLRDRPAGAARARHRRHLLRRRRPPRPARLPLRGGPAHAARGGHDDRPPRHAPPTLARPRRRRARRGDLGAPGGDSKTRRARRSTPPPAPSAPTIAASSPACGERASAPSSPATAAGRRAAPGCRRATPCGPGTAPRRSRRSPPTTASRPAPGTSSRPWRRGGDERAPGNLDHRRQLQHPRDDARVPALGRRRDARDRLRAARRRQRLLRRQRRRDRRRVPRPRADRPGGEHRLRPRQQPRRRAGAGRAPAAPQPGHGRARRRPRPPRQLRHRPAGRTHLGRPHPLRRPQPQPHLVLGRDERLEPLLPRRRPDRAASPTANASTPSRSATGSAIRSARWTSSPAACC